MRFLTFVIKNVTRRRTRSALTIVGLAVAVGAVVALVGIASGFERSFLSLYQGHGIDVVVLREGIADRTTGSLNRSIGQQIAAVPGVERVEPVLIDSISFENVGMMGVAVQGLEPGSKMIADFKIDSGRAIRPGETKVAMLGRILAEKLGKEVGQKIEIFEDEFCEVVGIYDAYNPFENSALVIPLDHLQHLLDRQGQVTMFNVVVDPGQGQADVQRVTQGIKDLGLGLSAMATEEYVSSDPKLDIASAMAWSTSVIALVVGAVGMLNTMIMSVFERTREIGILRAIGWRKSRVVRMILLEALVLSLVGAVVGTLGAVALTKLLNHFSAAGGLVGDRIEPRVMVTGFVIAIVIGLLGAVYPAYLGARLLPTDALRHE